MEIIREYTFTGFLPSGNPFQIYWDENQSAGFGTSIDSAVWEKQPKIGDKIKREMGGFYGEIIERVWINNVLVSCCIFSFSGERS